MLIGTKETLRQIPLFKRVVVGISGGPDSVALAYLLKNLGYRVILAHLNHNLRGSESDGDEALVRQLAREWDLPLVCKKINLPKSGNLENHARQARYEFLEAVRKKHKAKFIAVGHHQNDQVETIVMHIDRGAGTRGRCGMYAQNEKIIRPFLNTTKQNILEFINQNKLIYRLDSSNQDLSFKRNEVRHKVIPKLEKKWENFQVNLLKLSEISKKRIKKNQTHAKKWLTQRVLNHRFSRVSFLKLPDSVQSEVIFQIVGHKDAYRGSVNEIKKLIQQGGTGKKKIIKNFIFQVEYNDICFVKDIKITAPLKKTAIRQKTKWGHWVLTYRGSGSIYARTWQPGDRFQPTGMQGSKKLQDFFVDAKIPQSERLNIPIIVNEKDEILSIANLRLSKKGLNLKQSLNIDKNTKI